MTKYTLEMIQHMAAIQTPLPASYYDAAEVDASLAQALPACGHRGRGVTHNEAWYRIWTWFWFIVSVTLLAILGVVVFR